MAPRTTLLEALGRQLRATSASGTTLTLVLLDADDFAAVSARLGPRGAAKLLGELEHRLGAAARAGDIVCRTGGDGLAAILPDGGRLDGESAFARLKARLRDDPIDGGPVELSAGIATALPGERPIELLARASRALREAKQAGKGTAKAAS